MHHDDPDVPTAAPAPASSRRPTLSTVVATVVALAASIAGRFGLVLTAEETAGLLVLVSFAVDLATHRRGAR